MAELVRDPGDERPFRPDHHEVDSEFAREPEQPFGVLGAHRMAVAERSDPRIARRGVQLVEPIAAGELPRERVLPAS